LDERVDATIHKAKAKNLTFNAKAKDKFNKIVLDDSLKSRSRTIPSLELHETLEDFNIYAHHMM